MVAVSEVLLAQRAAGFNTAVQLVQARADGDRRHAQAGEGEVVGAVEETGLQVRVRAVAAAAGLGHALQIAFQRHPALAPRSDVAGRAIRAEHLDVQHCSGLVQWRQRVRGVVAGAQQALLFGGEGHEVQRALRLRAGGEHAAQFQHRGHAGGVVDRTTADAVALGVGLADTEGIPVRGEDHGLVGVFTTGQLGHHVAGHHLLALEREIHAQLRVVQCHRAEVCTHRLALLGIEVEAGVGEDRLGQLALHPATQRRVLRRRLGLAAFDVKQRRGTRALHGGPAIRGRRGLVHDQHALGATARSFLELVGPAAVVGHRLAVERTRRISLEIGVVDQHDSDLAVQVHVLVVVPLAFRRVDAVADEHQRGILDLHALARLQALQGHVHAVGQRTLATLQRQAGLGRSVQLRAHQRHRLHPAAVHAARLQAIAAELLDQVLHRALFALGGRRAALEFIRRQHTHMARQCLRIDAAARQVVGRMGQATDEQAGRQQQHAHRIHGSTTASLEVTRV